MTRDEVQKTVLEVVESHFYLTAGERAQGADLDLREAGGDSLDMLEVAMEVEERLNVDLDDEALTKCKTVGDVVALAWAQVKR